MVRHLRYRFQQFFGYGSSMLNDGNVNGVLSKFDVSIDLYCLFCLDYFMLKPLLHHYLSLLLVLSIYQGSRLLYYKLFYL